MRKTIPFLLSLLLAPALTAQALNIYVTTATITQGFVENDAKQRTDSVRDIKALLARNKKLNAIVEDSDQADVILTVVGRNDVATGNTTTTGTLYGAHTNLDYAAVVNVELQAGDYKTQFTGAAPIGQAWVLES